MMQQAQSSIDLYGCKYDKICLLTSTGQIIEEAPGLKTEGVFSRFSAGFLLSYKSHYDYVGISLLAEDRYQDGILCYNKCILDEAKTTVIYSHEDINADKLIWKYILRYRYRRYGCVVPKSKEI